ncbi:MAG: gephyrin-like molybdotransferase Glp [Candidatus Neomarinimicrobiota bacterium]
MKLISVGEARTLIAGNTVSAKIEFEPIEKLSGRILGDNVYAPFPTPLFDNSAMDGFALRAQDTRGATLKTPVLLKLKGVIPAGFSGKLAIGAGECAQCMTGAPIPAGADAVVPVEKTSGFDQPGPVNIFLEAKAGRHVRYQGEETKKGELLIGKGTMISPPELGILATFGFGKIRVFRRPRVALFATGNELVDPGKKLRRGQIFNSNFYVLADLVRRAGAQIEFKQVVKDDPDDLIKIMGAALTQCDIIVTSGGVSMGRFDFIRKDLQALNVKEHFWRVAQKPGKPLFFGGGEKTMLFGLPGNPVSAFISFMEYVWPVLENLSGREPEKVFEAFLTVSFPREAQKHRFLFGKTWYEKGRWLCTPAKKTGSHMLTAALEANCIIGVAPGPGPLARGSAVSAKLLPWMK